MAPLPSIHITDPTLIIRAAAEPPVPRIPALAPLPRPSAPTAHKSLSYRALIVPVFLRLFPIVRPGAAGSRAHRAFANVRQV